jgi:xanthine dehydrogenase iron-sulfur cluster and FAD-binding subunit A
MFPAKIDSLSRPKTVAEAAALIASDEEGNVLPIAGGMSLMQAIKARVVRPGAIVDLNDIGELKGIKETASSVWIGAMTRYVEVATSDVLKSGAFGALRTQPPMSAIVRSAIAALSGDHFAGITSRPAFPLRRLRSARRSSSFQKVHQAVTRRAWFRSMTSSSGRWRLLVARKRSFGRSR